MTKPKTPIAPVEYQPVVISARFETIEGRSKEGDDDAIDVDDMLEALKHTTPR